MNCGNRPHMSPFKEPLAVRALYNARLVKKYRYLKPMPIYEYQCQQCGHELERIQKMSDEPLRDCPACEKPELRKLISAAAFRLKGNGWYETDFKQGQKRNIADSGNESSASSAGSGNGASKPATTNSAAKDSAKPDAKPASPKSTDSKSVAKGSGDTA